MKNTLRKYDDVLTTDERFHLALAAMARDDEAEVKRLVSSCPRCAYTMTDLAFMEQWEGSYAVAMIFSAFWLFMQLRYTEAQWLVSAREHLIERGVTRMPADEAIDLLIRRGGELKGAHVGLIRFCEAARLDQDALLAWWPPIREEIEAVRWLLDEEMIEGDGEVAAAIYRALASHWPALQETVRQGGSW